MKVPKPLLIIVAVVLILFVIFLLIGATHGGDRISGDTPGWVDALRRGGAVRLDEIDSPCRVGSTFDVVFPQCVAQIDPSGSSVRRLNLRLTEGGPVTFTLEGEFDSPFDSPQGKVTVKATVPDDDEDPFRTTLNVHKGGGRLTIGCNTFPCLIRIVTD